MKLTSRKLERLWVLINPCQREKDKEDKRGRSVDYIDKILIGYML